VKKKTAQISGLSLSGLIITFGIVYGDIGTSPLYVMKAIVAGARTTIDEGYILGALSCIIWTLTLQTTLKYIFITLKADNHGEGGILALYALIRKKKKWIFIPAIIGAAALLADGVITPSITVVSSVEGLSLIRSQVPVIPIALVIIAILFTIQQFGTSSIGKTFGPMMLIWFLMLAVLGLSHIFDYPAVLKAFNPIYGIKLLVNYPGGFLLLGAVFLCTTGAEALYSDLGHCGLHNIRISWIFVKSALILNYLGQGAWLLHNPDVLSSGINPFFGIMPAWFLLPGIIIATIAAIIASQALISGSYTILSEAVSLNFWPRVKITYPSVYRGQMYISMINWFLFFACCFVILYFRESSNMEAAYGLAITITMLMTTLLMIFYLMKIHRPKFLIVGFVAIYLSIEGSFLVANLHKFSYGGWFTLLLTFLIFIMMYTWFRGRQLKKKFLFFKKIDDYSGMLKALRNDVSVPKVATNLVYLTRADFKTDVESKILFSIFYKQPKRADHYWLLHLHIVEEPFKLEYKVDKLIPDILTRVEFVVGFKVQPRLNLFFREVIDDLQKSEEFDLTSNYESLRKYKIPGDFRFVLIDRIQNYDFDFRKFDQFIMNIYSILKRIGISDVKAFGLDSSSVLVEKVPLESEDMINEFKNRFRINRLPESRKR
jgi:KUP system potassium uptake protein